MPIAVETHGFSWTAGGAWTAVVLLFGIIVRQVGPWRKQSIDAEQRLRDDLLRRVEKLEKVLDRERAKHDAERALDRHKFANVAGCFDALLMMLEAAPERLPDILPKIKEMRARQLEAEALEKATIHAAEMAMSDMDGEK